ncbi:MAG: biopolymer transporter ExbD [Steroidobacteraceae bacterium]
MSSKVFGRVKRNHQRARGNHDLNVVPMIDMMIILVFFLIFSAVFTRTSILELNFPTAQTAIPDLPQGLQLEVVVRKTSIEVSDRNTGLLKSLPNLANGYDIAGLSEYLMLVKSKYQDKQDASILLEPEIPYDTLVQVMDSVRVYVPKDKYINQAELFPEVSVGDAPT